MPPLRPTPSQTVGPFFSIGLTGREQNRLDPAAGDAIELHGRVLDGEDAAVPDAVVELWHPQAWGRCGTNSAGAYSFTLGRPQPGGGQAPHVTLLIFARGLLKPVMTRLYFPDEQERNDADPVLMGVEPAEREALTAVAEGGGLRFDVHLQGDRQTPFFVL